MHGRRENVYIRPTRPLCRLQNSSLKFRVIECIYCAMIRLKAWIKLKGYEGKKINKLSYIWYSPLSVQTIKTAAVAYSFQTFAPKSLQELINNHQPPLI